MSWSPQNLINSSKLIIYNLGLMYLLNVSLRPICIICIMSKYSSSLSRISFDLISYSSCSYLYFWKFKLSKTETSDRYASSSVLASYGKINLDIIFSNILNSLKSTLFEAFPLLSPNIPDYEEYSLHTLLEGENPLDILLSLKPPLVFLLFF